MSQNFLVCDRDQRMLLPADMREWLAEDHLAELFSEVLVLCPPDADRRKAPAKIRSGPDYERMRRRLKEPEAEAAYLRRQQRSSLFAQIKLRQRGEVPRRGLSACRAEWRLTAATHNLLKLYSAGLRIQAA